MAKEPGRPSKLKPDRVNRLIEALKAGNTLKASAGYAGINYSTFARWMVRGEAEKSGEYKDFREAVKNAEHEAEVYHVTNIRRHSAENWQASAWYLERRRPDDYRKRESHEITGPDNGPIALKWSDD